MSDEKGGKKKGGDGDGPAKKKGKMALWQKGLLGLAVVVMGAGIALSFAGGGEPPAPAGGGAGSDLVRGLTSGGTEAPAPAGAGVGQGDDWSPAIFRMGFSAFVGFAIGFALRTFVKLSLVGIGFFLLLMFGLEYAQIIEVQWGAVGDRYDDAAGWLERNTGSFMDFVKGQLPAAGLFGVGLVAGFKR